jgi:DNA-binding transcriptional MerR regulator
MELLDLPQLAERADIPLSLARYYRERFVLFVPSVRIGRTVLHPPEAIEVLRRIHAEAGQGANVEAIVQILEVVSPISITSAQPLQADGAVAGAAGVINSLASALDQRGERIEAELASLRELLGATAAALRMHPIAPKARGDSEGTAELAGLRRELADLRTAIGLLASRDQMEWIGDVVAAAVITPQPHVADPAIEQRLAELQAEIRRLRPSSEAAELRVAVERLTDYVHHRDTELRRAFQTLVGALRSEVRGMRGVMDEIRQAIGIDEAPSGSGPIPFPTPAGGGFLREVPDGDDPADDAGVDVLHSRSPRRLGQPTKPAGGSNGDADPATGSSSTPAT